MKPVTEEGDGEDCGLSPQAAAVWTELAFTHLLLLAHFAHPVLVHSWVAVLLALPGHLVRRELLGWPGACCLRGHALSRAISPAGERGSGSLFMGKQPPPP